MKKETFIVTIDKCTHDEKWYAGWIGKRIKVQHAKKGYYKLIGLQSSLILKSDCTFIETISIQYSDTPLYDQAGLEHIIINREEPIADMSLLLKDLKGSRTVIKFSNSEEMTEIVNICNDNFLDECVNPLPKCNCFSLLYEIDGLSSAPEQFYIDNKYTIIPAKDFILVNTPITTTDETQSTGLMQDKPLPLLWSDLKGTDTVIDVQKATKTDLELIAAIMGLKTSFSDYYPYISCSIMGGVPHSDANGTVYDIISSNDFIDANMPELVGLRNPVLLTKEEAKEAMKAGKKISYLYDTDSEWMESNPEGTIITLDSDPESTLSADDFWEHKQDKMYDSGYRIVNPINPAKKDEQTDHEDENRIERGSKLVYGLLDVLAKDMSPQPIPVAADQATTGEESRLVVQKFTKNPVQVEAIKFTNENKDFVYSWARGYQSNIHASFDKKDNPILLIPTLEGEMECSIGDYLIKEPFPTDWRKFYPCKPSVFESTYTASYSQPEQHYADDAVTKAWTKGYASAVATIASIHGSRQDKHYYEAWRASGITREMCIAHGVGEYDMDILTKYNYI